MKTAKFQIGFNVTMIGSKGLNAAQREKIMGFEPGKAAGIDLEDWIKAQLKLGKFKNCQLQVSSSGSLIVNICDKAEFTIKAVEAEVKEEKLSLTDNLLRSLGL